MYDVERRVVNSNTLKVIINKRLIKCSKRKEHRKILILFFDFFY